MSEPPYADVLPEPGGFSIPELKWRELLFIGALRAEGDGFVRDPARPLPPFTHPGLFPENVRFHAERRGERVLVRPDPSESARIIGCWGDLNSPEEPHTK